MPIDETHRALGGELELLRDADERAATYISRVASQRVFPDSPTIARLAEFTQALPEQGLAAEATLELLDRVGSPATAVSNGPNYFGYVIGASLPAAAAAERLARAPQLAPRVHHQPKRSDARKA